MQGINPKEFNAAINNFSSAIRNIGFSAQEFIHMMDQLEIDGLYEGPKNYVDPTPFNPAVINGLLDIDYVSTYSNIDFHVSGAIEHRMEFSKEGRPTAIVTSYDANEAQSILEVHFNSEERLDTDLEYKDTFIRFE